MEARRIVISELRQAQVEEFELDIESLAPGEVILRTLVTLVSPGTEGAAFLGLKAPGQAEESPFPRKVGYAYVGQVIATGPEARASEGELVYTTASHSSLARVDTHRQVCVRIPEGVRPEEAVFTRMATVSMASLRTTSARAGDRAAVVGLGLVGNLAAQLCEISGMPTTALDLLPFRCEIAKRCGLANVSSSTKPAEPTNQHGLVLECTGTPGGALTALQLAQPGGDVSLVGAPWGWGHGSPPAHEVLERIFSGYVRVRSGWEWQLPNLPAPFTPGSHEENSRRALDLISQGRLKIHALRTHLLPPERAQEAFEGLVNKKEEYLGVVFKWADPEARTQQGGTA